MPTEVSTVTDDQRLSGIVRRQPAFSEKHTRRKAADLEVMLDCWGEVFQPYFGNDEHWDFRRNDCNVRSIVQLTELGAASMEREMRLRAL